MNRGARFQGYALRHYTNDQGVKGLIISDGIKTEFISNNDLRDLIDKGSIHIHNIKIGPKGGIDIDKSKKHFSEPTIFYNNLLATMNNLGIKNRTLVLDLLSKLNEINELDIIEPQHLEIKDELINLLVMYFKYMTGVDYRLIGILDLSDTVRYTKQFKKNKIVQEDFRVGLLDFFGVTNTIRVDSIIKSPLNGIEILKVIRVNFGNSKSDRSEITKAQIRNGLNLIATMLYTYSEYNIAGELLLEAYVDRVNMIILDRVKSGERIKADKCKITVEEVNKIVSSRIAETQKQMMKRMETIKEHSKELNDAVKGIKSFEGLFIIGDRGMIDYSKISDPKIMLDSLINFHMNNIQEIFRSLIEATKSKKELSALSSAFKVTGAITNSATVSAAGMVADTTTGVAFGKLAVKASVAGFNTAMCEIISKKSDLGLTNKAKEILILACNLPDGYCATIYYYLQKIIYCKYGSAKQIDKFRELKVVDNQIIDDIFTGYYMVERQLAHTNKKLMSYYLKEELIEEKAFLSAYIIARDNLIYNSKFVDENWVEILMTLVHRATVVSFNQAFRGMAKQLKFSYWFINNFGGKYKWFNIYKGNDAVRYSLSTKVIEKFQYNDIHVENYIDFWAV